MNASLLAAMILVESGGNPRAIGDHGRSVGILQISRVVVADVNRITGTRYKWPSDCFDPQTSVKICEAYLSHYGGNDASDQRLARIWVGGPEGNRKAKTVSYWRRVRANMQSKP